MTILFSEGFENNSFAARGWYDSSGAGGLVDTVVVAPGSAGSFKCHWNLGGTGPAGGTPHRHLFTATERLYLQFQLKLGTSGVPWQGSGQPYHPHLFQFLTDADNDFVGPNSALFSALVETSLFTPRLAESDGPSMNVANIGVNLLTSALAHALAGGNGSQNGSATYFEDFPGAGTYSNSTYWDAPGAVFVNDTWHKVGVYMQMNSVSGGIAQPDGIFRYYVDDVIVINATNVYMRDGTNPNRKFDKLLLAPYIGDGSPIAQDLWIDSMFVADEMPAPARVSSFVETGQYV